MKERLQFVRGAEGFALRTGSSLRPLRSHHHDELEVNVVLSGKAAYLFDQRRIPLPTGSMIWLFPRQEHVLIDWSSDFSMWILVFRPALVRRGTTANDRRVLRKLDPGEIFCRQLPPGEIPFLSRVYRDAATPELDLARANAALGYALTASWDAYARSGQEMPGTDVHPAVGRAATLLVESDAYLPLEELARKAGLSPARLSRLFKRQTGTSLTAFRQRQCLERFLRFYQTGARYTLIEAALRAGFGSYPQFHRVFRRMMGRNPASYRRSLAGMETASLPPSSS